MATIPMKNFAKGTVSTGYNSAATSIVLTTGHGSKFDATFPYNLVWWNSTDYPNPADDPNVEIVTVSGRSSDTLTLSARGAEGTVASNKNTASKVYLMAQCPTKAMLDQFVLKSGDTMTGALTLSGNPSSALHAVTKQYDDAKGAGPKFLSRGLLCGTHPDADKEATKLFFEASELWLDGNAGAVQSWPRTVVDIAASGGINQLDAGSKVNNTWYELLAIQNFSTGTKAGLLHRMPNTKKDVEQATVAASENFRDASARQRLAQGFQVVTAGKCPVIEVYVDRVGSPTDYFYLELCSDSSGSPGGVLATSEIYAAGEIPTTNNWMPFVFRSLPVLSTSTQYHWVVRGATTVSGVNNFRVKGSSTGVYASGSFKQFDGTTWSACANVLDAAFRIWIIENETSAVLPSGYDCKGTISYAYVDGSGNFKRYWQKDNTIFCGDQVSGWQVLSGFTATAPTWTDLAAFLPPVPVRVRWQAGSGAAAYMACGGYRGFNSVPSGGNAYTRTQYINGFSSSVPGGFTQEILYEWQRGYFAVNSATWAAWVGTMEF